LLLLLLRGLCLYDLKLPIFPSPLQFGKTALHWAAHWGRMELVLKLLDKGAVLDKRDEVRKAAGVAAVFVTSP
jgi:ankyrin repeat protein